MNSDEFRAAVAHVAGDQEVDASIDEVCEYIDLANDRVIRKVDVDYISLNPISGVLSVFGTYHLDSKPR